MPEENPRGAEMASWDTSPAGVEARIKATRAFCEFLDDPQNKQRRAECQESSDTARRLFAELGHFYVEGDSNIPSDLKPIPRKTIFNVYEEDPADKRDELVTIVLPKVGGMPAANLFQARDYYRCSYWPY